MWDKEAEITDSHPGGTRKSEMIRSRRPLQRSEISRLLFRAHGTGIMLNPQRHFTAFVSRPFVPCWHVWGSLHPCAAPDVPEGPFCPSRPKAAHPRPGSVPAPSALCEAIGGRGRDRHGASTEVAARGAPERAVGWACGAAVGPRAAQNPEDSQRGGGMVRRWQPRGWRGSRGSPGAEFGGRIPHQNPPGLPEGPCPWPGGRSAPLRSAPRAHCGR